MRKNKSFGDLIDKYRDDLEYRIEAAILEFNEKIVTHMEANSISRAELSRRLGVSKAFVTKMLNGNPNLTIKTMMSVADALGCELNLEIYPKGDKSKNCKEKDKVRNKRNIGVIGKEAKDGKRKVRAA